jgi:hypothetical protein
MRAVRTLAVLALPGLVIAVAAVTALFASQGTEFRTGYAVGDVAVGLYSVSFTAPLVAAWAAFTVGRFRRLLERPVRVVSSLARAGSALGLGMGLSWLATVTAISFLIRPAVSRSLVAQGYLLPLIAFAASAALGTLLAMAMSPYFSVPLSAIATWGWFSLPQTTNAVGARNANLATALGSCCSRIEQPSITSIISSLILASVLVVGCLAFLAAWQRRSLITVTTRLGVAAFVVTIATVSAVGFGARGTYAALEPRTGDVTCRTDRTMEICVWPENAAALDSFAEAATQVTTASTTGDLRVPRRWSERAEPGTVVVEWNSETPTTMHQSVVAYALATYWGCPLELREEVASSIVSVIAGGGTQQGMRSTVVEKCRGAGL